MNTPICPVCKDNDRKWHLVREDSDILIINEQVRDVRQTTRICANINCGFRMVQMIPLDQETANSARLGKSLMNGDKDVE